MNFANVRMGKPAVPEIATVVGTYWRYKSWRDGVWRCPAPIPRGI